MEGAQDMKGKKHTAGNPILEAIKAIVIGSVTGALLSAILLGLAALGFVSAGNFSHNVISPMMIALSVLAAFAAGFLTAKVSRKRGLAYGALSGLLLFILYLIAGLVASNEPVSFTAGMRMIVMILSGAIGGLLGVNKKSKVK
ncbi:TIGR04086 family membrane protein [Caproiciproducens galactitolivorans]|nr:TIGR04086 family membrane protein [Caproiciproducens galactitolivorans]